MKTKVVLFIVAVLAALVGPIAFGSDLGGTAWRLVRFQGGDGTTLTPDDKAKYTLQFEADGNLFARIDCNRGRGTWKSEGPEIELGELALTRAMCPPGSMHDQIVKQWKYVRSYVVKEGRLFLSLMADGGTFELEPIPEEERHQ
jgi:para-nitrobenzyl esterase